MRLPGRIPVMLRPVYGPRTVTRLQGAIETQRRTISRQGRELDAAQADAARLRALLTRMDTAA